MKRRAFTLLEAVIVAVIIVIIASLAYPSVRNMQGGYKLNAAVDGMRSAWAKARARAIEEGRPYRVSIEPNGSCYRIAPDQDDYWSGQAPADDPKGKGLVTAGALPSGVRFSLDGAAQNLPNPNSDPEPDPKKVSPSAFSTAVVFLPDGTAREDVEIYFQIRGVRPALLQLRGLTGASTVRRVDP